MIRQTKTEILSGVSFQLAKLLIGKLEAYPTLLRGTRRDTRLLLPLILSWLLMPCSSADDAKSSVKGEHDTKGTTVRAAAISFVPVRFDLSGNADRLETAFRAAHQGNAKIAVAPEGSLEGYVVNEIIAGKVPAEKMREVAIPIDHEIIRRFRKLATELEMCLVFGFAERIENDIFNCAVFIGDDGRILGKYHKMQFAEGYDSSWWFNRLGRTSRAFDTPYGRCGILICNDRWNPQLAEIPVLDGAQFLVIPSYGSRSKSQDEAVLSRAQENGVPIVEANVGVTLVVNDNAITAVDRQENGITFAEISIPPAVKTQPLKRDEVESAFLQWREEEMRDRLKRTQKRLLELGKGVRNQ